MAQIISGALDFRSGSAVYGPQLATLEGFTATRTVVDFVMADENIILAYTAAAPADPNKFLIYDYQQRVSDLGSTGAVDTEIEGFIGAKTIKKIVPLPEGSLFLVWYS